MQATLACGSKGLPGCKDGLLLAEAVAGKLLEAAGSAIALCSCTKLWRERSSSPRLPSLKSRSAKINQGSTELAPAQVQAALRSPP